MKSYLTLHHFSREETSFLKGIGILMVVLHNYYRWINPIIGENEFGFSATYIMSSLALLRTNPLETFDVFFKLFGHYGIQVFMVISSYGLTVSYAKSNPDYGNYLLHRFNKIYPSLVMAGIVFLVFKLIQGGGAIDKGLIPDLVLQLSLAANLVPGKAMATNGPWWFYSFIFQFYIIFPAMFLIHRKHGGRGLLALAMTGYFVTTLLYEPMRALNLNPYMMVVGHIPELSLGIYLASIEEIRLPWWIFAGALLISIGGNLSSWLWPFANLGAAIVLIVTIQGILKWRGTMPAALFDTVSSVGVVSMYIFACHGYLRWKFISIANELASPLSGLLLGIIFFTLATGVAFLMMRTERSVRDWIMVPAKISSRYRRFFLVCFLTIGGFPLLIH
jgi:peptidoglycan/LPS O-acetylase OafA/YrhL